MAIYLKSGVFALYLIKDAQLCKKFLNRIEKTLDIRERMNAGYSFAGDNSNLPQLGNPFNGAI